MDTRSKILPRGAAAPGALALPSNGGGAVTAAGWFDVLQAAHAERLSEARRNHSHLVVFVYDDRPDRRGLLDAASRAQMVAALAVVDSVVICDEAEAASLAARLHLPPPLLVEEAMPRDIVADVLQRYQVK